MIIEPKPCTGLARGYFVTFDNGMRLSVTTALLDFTGKHYAEGLTNAEAWREPDKYCKNLVPEGLLDVALLKPTEKPDREWDFVTPTIKSDEEQNELWAKYLTQAQVTELIDRLRAEPKEVATW